MKENQLALNGYIGFGFIYLLTLWLGLDNIAVYIKPLLLPFLLYPVYRAEYFGLKKVLLAALAFSWFGDVMQMLATRSEIYYIVGLLLVLVSHFFYIELFFRYKGSEKPFRKPLFWIGTAAVLFYLKLILGYILPKADDFKIAVVVYGVTISLLLLTALWLFCASKRSGKYPIISGALFLATSDSLLAINKFGQPIAYANLIVVSTYLIGQYCMATGVIRLHRRKKN